MVTRKNRFVRSQHTRMAKFGDRPDIPALARIFGAVLMLMVAGLTQAVALEPIGIGDDNPVVDLMPATTFERNQGDSIQISTAPGLDGVVRRIEVQAQQPETAGNWAIFALANLTDDQIDRIIVTPHYRLAGSGLFWPDLGQSRIASITPSEGFALERIDSDDSDIFQITLNPGSVITFVVEMAATDLPQIQLWEPEAHEERLNSFTLYRGIVLGIAGLLAVFLTILFVVKGTAMFPAAAALAWAVLAYICIDFGFWEQLIDVAPGDERIWRAGTEVMLAASLVIFLVTYLNLGRWHVHLSYGALAWLIGLVTLFGVAIINPPVASGIARLSLAATGVVGLGLIVYLSINRYDRAVMLVPTWILFLAWTAGAFITVTGSLDNEIIQPALGGGLVLIVLLIGFTVMQHAFAGGAYSEGLFSNMERQSLAMSGSGDMVWDWDVMRDRIVTIPNAGRSLGLGADVLHGPARSWIPLLHPDDRDRFRTLLDVVLDHRRGKLFQDFRLRAKDGHYHWLSLKARPVLGSDGEVLRCVGTLSDVTQHRNAQERLLHDAVHDNLTGLPNRELFVDRLNTTIALAQSHGDIRPAVLMIDIDHFKSVNDRLGMTAGDTILLSLARRLARMLDEQDTLARLPGDCFALILLSQQEPDRVAAFAKAMSKSIKTPITFAGQDLNLTASTGLTTWSAGQDSAVDMLKNAELAMLQAKRFGGDRIEPFRPSFRTAQSDVLKLRSDLEKALEGDEIEFLYQPVMRISERKIIGFQTVFQWAHPQRGILSFQEFLPVAEQLAATAKISLMGLEAAGQLARQFTKADDDNGLFVSVGVQGIEALRQDLISDARSMLYRTRCPAGRLALEIPEALITQNPESAQNILNQIRELGLRLSLQGFGEGPSFLSYLCRIAFQNIKVGHAFIGSKDPRQLALLGSILSMAQDLDMRMVAENVCSDDEIDILSGLGCDFIQGPVFGDPLSADAVMRALKHQNSPNRQSMETQKPAGSPGLVPPSPSHADIASPSLAASGSAQ